MEVKYFFWKMKITRNMEEFKKLVVKQFSYKKVILTQLVTLIHLFIRTIYTLIFLLTISLNFKNHS